MIDFAIYGTLALMVYLYTRLLDRHKERLEPDFTWVEVVIGCALCFAAAATRARYVPGGWQEYEQSVWLAFVVGGGVIIGWQIRRAIQRAEEVRKRGRTRPEKMAEERRSRTPGDD
jgi:hypothetical protein